MDLIQILQDINSQSYTLDELRGIIAQSSVNVPDAGSTAVTVLYSGKLSDNLHTGAVAEAISDASRDSNNLKQVVTIADIDAYRLLKSDELDRAIDRAIQGLPDAENIKTQFFDGINDANGVRTQPGVWDDMSL